jgi:hypothetical protein
MTFIDGSDEHLDDLDEEGLLKSLLAAFEAVCYRANIESRDDPLAETLALMVVKAARTGERNPERLRDLVFRGLYSS